MSDEVIKHAYYITAFASGIIYYMKIKKQIQQPKLRNLFYRSDWIRTSGLFVPNEALYHAEPHPVKIQRTILYMTVY